MEVMEGVLKNKLLLGVGIIAVLAIFALILIFKNECNYVPSTEVKSIIKGFNKLSDGKYEALMDKCYPEIHIIIQDENIDSTLYHNLLVKLNRAESPAHKVNIYNRDSILLYVEYTVLRSGDTSYHVIQDYDY